jgi:hypothetical protein
LPVVGAILPLPNPFNRRDERIAIGVDRALSQRYQRHLFIVGEQR